MTKEERSSLKMAIDIVAPDKHWIFSEVPGGKIAIRFQDPKTKPVATIAECPTHADVLNAILNVLSTTRDRYSQGQILQLALALFSLIGRLDNIRGSKV